MNKLNYFTFGIIMTSSVSCYAQALVDLNGNSLQWTSSVGTTNGYPTLTNGGSSPTTGYNASTTLSNGVNLTVSSTAFGSGSPYAHDGTQVGNLNVLDGSDPGIDTTPIIPGYTTDPNPVANETTGFTLSGGSEGQEGNGSSLTNYIRYDFMFDQLVTLGDITISDIDGLLLDTYNGSGDLLFTSNVYEDSLALVGYTTNSITGPTIDITATARGANVAEMTGHGITYYKGLASDGLTNSEDPLHTATFSTSEDVYGFSIFYFDDLDSTLPYDGGMTLALDNFEIITVPEPSTLFFSGLAAFGLLARRQRN